MRNGVLNAYNLHKKTIFFKKYEKILLITKYLIKDKRTSRHRAMLCKLKVWGQKRDDSMSHQTAVCRRNGGFKRVINLIGFDRHMSRQHLNLKRIPVVKKMSW